MHLQLLLWLLLWSQFKIVVFIFTDCPLHSLPYKMTVKPVETWRHQAQLIIVISSHQFWTDFDSDLCRKHDIWGMMAGLLDERHNWGLFDKLPALKSLPSVEVCFVFFSIFLLLFSSGRVSLFSSRLVVSLRLLQRSVVQRHANPLPLPSSLISLGWQWGVGLRGSSSLPSTTSLLKHSLEPPVLTLQILLEHSNI